LQSDCAAYLAGLIDGEGTVTLTRLHRYGNRRLVVSISNCELAILEHVRNGIGAGKITSKKTYREHHARSFTYQISSRQALQLLVQVVGFMKSYKAERARLALLEYLRVTPRNGHYRPEVAVARRNFEARLLAIVPRLAS